MTNLSSTKEPGGYRRMPLLLVILCQADIIKKQWLPLVNDINWEETQKETDGMNIPGKPVNNLV